MSNVRFELDINGLRELMKSGEMKGVLDEAGRSVAGRASAMSGGEEYGHRVHDASYVSIVNIYPDSKEAAEENSANNTVLKALTSSGLPMTK